MGIFGGKQAPARPTRPEAPTPAQPAATHRPSGTQSAAATCVIGAKTTISGEIAGEEDILVEGTVEGQIRIGRSLTVGSEGTVKATVHAQSVVVRGKLIGDCNVTSRIEIQATGRLTGSIRSPKIVIAEGAMFKGTSDMSPANSNAGGRGKAP